MAGGCDSCLNGGTCQKNGYCECKIGYSGSTCDNCKNKFNFFFI
jgi:hypothetical protein